MSNVDIATPVDRWSREIAHGMVSGHPSRIYRRSPANVAELLVDARRWRERTFLVEGSRRLTFDEHEQAVARVAAHLAARGVGRGDRVVLLAYNRLEWIVAFWAVQALGAVAVLGNAWWSDEEALRALALVDPAAVITDRASERPLSSAGGTIELSSLRPVIDGGTPAELPVPRVGGDDPAIIMFSSGTTGAAKGLVMSQRSVVANIQNLLVLTGRLPHEIDPAQPGTVSLLTVPLFHLAGIQISFSTLLSGGTLVLLEGRFDPQAVLRLIAREKVRVWGSVPTMVSRVIDCDGFAAYDTTSLRSIPMGGAAITQALRDKIRDAFPGIQKRVGNLYGLTEAGGVLAAGSGAQIQDKPKCVGKPLPVVELRIDRPDPSGVGEILARTPSMTLGYWGDSAPLTDADGWLRTGDLGRLDDEGFLYVVGRSKDIIIRGGENIASQHVEQCLLRHPDVQECAVIALPHADLGEEVAAAVVARPGASLNAERLRQHALSHLAKFEVPSRWWIRHDALPTNASGKIVKRDIGSGWQDVDGV